MQVGILPPILGHWRSTTSNRFVLHMVKSHDLQFMCHPMLFHNFKQFNMKDTTTCCPVIQKEVDELLAKDIIEASADVDGFY